MNPRVPFPRLFRLGPCLAVAAVLLVPPPSYAQEKSKDYRNGTQFFRLVLQKQCDDPKFITEETLPPNEDPHNCMVVILGNPDGLKRIPQDIDAFLSGGGAVLFATDWPATDTQLNRAYNIQISGDIVSCDDRQNTYLGDKLLPFVEASPNDGTGLFKSGKAEVNGPTRRPIAANVSSYINPVLGGLPVLATLPKRCAILHRNRQPVRRVEALPFAVGRTIGNEGGRLLVLADHSVFINLMMQHADNGNFDFAIRVAAWLAECDTGKRKRIYFLEDDVPQGSVTVEQLQKLPVPPEIPKPSLNALVPFADELMHEQLEEKDILNRWLVEHLPPGRLMRWLLIVLTVLLVFYGFVRSRRNRHTVETAAPLLATTIKRARPNATAIELRHESLMASDNLWEPARLIARRFFEDALGAALAVPGAGRTRMPAFKIEGGGLRGWLMGQRLRRLWRFAHHPLPQPVTMSQFRSFAAKVADLTDAVARGRIRFSTTFQPTAAR
jgi:hypothetical protein